MKKLFYTGMLAVFAVLLPCTFPDFWKKWFSLPVLGFLNRIGSAIPFSLLEWGLCTLVTMLFSSMLFGLLRKQAAAALRKSLKRILCVLLSALCMFSCIWLPLYGETDEIPPPSPHQLRMLCEELISRLNESAPDFSNLPNDLPAKYAAFPFWMRLMNISGFYSFFTGEALISPHQPAGAVPFVAVHESMHASGIAGEGRCNIAAWQACMERGGLYADSARLWALRYGLAQLRRTDYHAYAECTRRMTAETVRLFRETGGEYAPAPRTKFQSAFARIGGASTGDYEILTAWLAANMG